VVIRAPKGGIRIGGQDYPSGISLPDRYRKLLQGSSRADDPGAGTVPNLGRPAVPHVVTFRGMVTSLSRAYRDSDEALRHNQENAHAMLNDPVVAGPLFSRQTMASLLNWSIETEDDKDPKLKALAAEMTDIIRRIPNFTEYRRCLMEAIWYGRYGIQHAYGTHINRHGVRRRVIRKWIPVSGDKLLFRYDDGTGSYDPDQIGVRVSAALSKNDYIAGHRELEATGEGLGYFLQPWERNMWCIHRHMIRDGEFEDPISGGQIHGVGMRHFLYWVWYQKQETLAQIAELIDRTGMGFTIYFYPSGNETARAEVEKISKEQAHTNVILMPSEENDQYRVEQIPPNTQGLEVLRSVVEDFFGDMITRFILGQTLSSKSSSTGMNSGVAELQKDTLNHIVRYDAVKLEETITKECLHFLRDVNFPKYRNVDMWFRISTKSSAPQEELSALMQLWQMGAKIKASDIFDRLDLSMPDKDDFKLFNPPLVAQIEQMENQEQGSPGGMPDMPQEIPQDGDGDGVVGDGTEDQMSAMDGMPDQMDKDADEDREKRRIFGPIMYSKSSELRQAIKDAADWTDTAASESQKEAGNYRKGVFWWNGLEVAIETPKGTKRGPSWPALIAHYGYVKLTKSERDGDHLDVFIGPNPESELVVAIDQVTQGGRFDEHKVVIGCTSVKEATDLYKSSYSSGWTVGPVTAMTLDQFKCWLSIGTTKKPINTQVSKYAKQMTLWDEDSHPRVKSGETFSNPETGTEQHGGSWISTDAAVEASPKEQKKLELVDEDSGKTEDLQETENVEGPIEGPIEGESGGSGGGHPVRGLSDDGDSGSPSDSGANRGRSQDERIILAREQHTPAADRSRVPERLQQHLGDHQLEGVSAAISSMEANGGFLTCDGTGVGKTRQMLAVAQHFLDEGKKVIVIAPKNVTKADWKKRTVAGSWQDDSEAMGVELNVTRDEVTPGVVNISSYQNLSKIKNLVDGDTVVIFDEAHALKNRTSAQASHGKAITENSHAVLFATATPIDKWEHLSYLDRAGVFGDEYFGKTYEQLGLHQISQRTRTGTVMKWEIKPGIKGTEVMRRISGLFDRLTADGKMLKRELDMTGVPVSIEQVKVPSEVHEMMDTIRTMIEGSSNNPGLEEARILMHQRRQQEPYKVQATVDIAVDAIANGRQAVIFASRVNESNVGEADEEGEFAVTSAGTMKLLLEELEKRGISAADVAQIHGGLKPSKLPKEMDRFQSGAAKVVIATVESGGTGINLDDTTGDAPRTLVMMTAPFSAVQNVQAAGRVWRLRTQSIPEIKFLFADTEVDDWNASLISEKMKTLGASVQGQVSALDVNSLTGADALEFTPEEPYEWKYPGEGRSKPTASFASLPSGEWGVRIKGHAKPGDVVEITKRDGSTQQKTVGEVIHSSGGKLGFTLATIGGSPPATQEPLPLPPPERVAPKVPEEQKQAILEGLRSIAAMDPDLALTRNDIGFNRFDGRYGHELASQDTLTDRQAGAAMKLVHKYRRQLDAEVVAAATKESESEKAPAPSKRASGLQGMLNWSDPRNVTTSQGARTVRSAIPTQEFWKEWRKNKAALKKQGVSVSKYQGEWQISWWQSLVDKNAKGFRWDQPSKRRYSRGPNLATEKLSPLFADGELDLHILERLRKIAGDFIGGTEIPRDAVIDVQVTGSLAGYSWDNRSDLDLHIIVDPEQLLAPPDMVQDYFYNVSSNWNAKHSITIKGHEVEVFVEPMEETAGDLLAVSASVIV